MPAPSAARPGPGRVPFVPAVALVVFAAIVMHVRSLGAPFFADDWLFLDQVRSRSLFDVLASPDPIGNYFRPLGRQLWFGLWATVSGESAFVFHAANLSCLLVAIVFLARLAKRAAGPTAGVIAAGFLALHYATDVPVLWASGSQELLSLALVLAALDLHVRGSRRAGAIVFVCALFAKEAVVLAPVAAIALDAQGGEWRARLRRASGWFVGLAVWLAIATIAAAMRGTPGAGLHLTLSGPLAAPLLLIRVVLGLEWATGAWPWLRWSDPGATTGWAIVAVVLSVIVIGWRAPRPGAKRAAGPLTPSTDPRHAIRAGLLWAIAGALPVAAVAPLWSAYYLLFALCGVGLALGAWLASRPVWVAALVLVLTGLTSSHARGLQEFATAPSAWSAQSHVNRFYLERGMAVITRGIEDLRAQMPAPQPRTTVFMAGLPSFAAFQVADGPLVRGVYRDTTLRGYYLSQMTRERFQRGPWRVFFYQPATGRLLDQTGAPGVLLSSALGMLYSGQLEVAEAALEAAAESGEPDMGRTYVSAWIAYERGDLKRAAERLEASGRRAVAGGEAAAAQVRRRLASGDTLGALLAVRRGLAEHGWDPSLHALAADLMLASEASRNEGGIEAYAARLLAPERGEHWRRWAGVLMSENRLEEAIEAFDRYAKADPDGWSADAEAQRTRAELVRMRPGGDLAQRALGQALQR